MCPAACSNLPRRLLPNNQNNSSHYYDNSPSYSIDDELRGYDAVAAAGSCQPPPSTAAGSLSPGEPASGSLPHHLYHAAPGSARRTLQSQSYFAYIQGLRLGSQTMCDWRRELAPTGELVARDNSGLYPHHHVTTIPPWLEKLYSSSQQTQPRVDSLCALRDFMLQEALNVVKFA